MSVRVYDNNLRLVAIAPDRGQMILCRKYVHEQFPSYAGARKTVFPKSFRSNQRLRAPSPVTAPYPKVAAMALHQRSRRKKATMSPSKGRVINRAKESQA